jgi:hypothetical protein
MCCAFRCKSHHNCKGNGRGVVGWWVLLLLMVPFPNPAPQMEKVEDV